MTCTSTWRRKLGKAPPGAGAARRCLVGAAAASILIAVSLATPQPTFGCSCVKPENWGFIGPEDGRLPSNAAGVLWFKPGQQPRQSVAARIAVERLREGRFEPVAASARRVEGFHGIYLVAPREGLAVGATYRFTDRGSILDYDFPRLADSVRPRGSGPHRQVRVTVDADPLTATSPLALKTGPSATEPIQVASGGGACAVRGQPVPHVPIEAVLASGARKWAGQLLFRTLVDDEPWAGASSLCSLYPSGRSWRQLGHDTVYSTCQAESRGEAPIAFREPRGFFRELAPGHHSLKMEAILPGTGIVLKSQTVTVDLGCPPTAVAAWREKAWFDLGPHPEPCECPGSLLEAGFIGEPEVRLPANAAGVPWYQFGLSGLVTPDPMEVLAARISVSMLNERGESTPLQTIASAVPGFLNVFVVAPKDGLVPGARYFFLDREHDDDWWRPGESLKLRGGVVATIDSRELQSGTTLSLHSTPVVRETLRVSTATFSRTCSVVGHYPHVRIEARLEGAGQAWRDGLLFQTLVDGKPWRGAGSSCFAGERRLGRSPAGAGHDIVYVPCGPEHETSGAARVWPHLQSGRHTVEMRAFLPGTDIVLDTGMLTVNLSCASSTEE